MNEDVLTGEAGEKALKKQEVTRKYWRQYDTELIAAWLLDHTESAQLNLTPEVLLDRERIINILAMEDWATVPKSTSKPKMLLDLQAIFKKHDPTHHGALPAMFDPNRVGFDLEGDDRPYEQKDEEMRYPASTVDARDQRIAELQAQLAEQSKQQQQQQQQQQQSRLAPLNLFARPGPPLAASSTSAAALDQRPLQCSTCSTPNYTPFSSWRCNNPSCELRGDLPISAPENVHFLKERERLHEAKLAVMRGGSAPAASATSVSSGQSTDSRADANLGFNSLDREYARAAAAAPTFDLFAGTNAGLQLGHTAALEMARKALAATSTQIPSEQLIALIRSGKIWKIGHAIPRQIMTGVVSGEGLAFDQASGGFKLESKQTPPPDGCATMHSFVAALVSTILPALIDRPAAMMNWIVLARTALEIERTESWKAASDYITQLLMQQVSTRSPFIDVDRSVLQNVIWQNRSTPNTQHQPSRQPASQPSGSTELRRCQDFNNGVTCAAVRNGGVCPLVHACHRCKQAGHGLKECKQPSMTGGRPANNQHHGSRTLPSSGSSVQTSRQEKWPLR